MKKLNRQNKAKKLNKQIKKRFKILTVILIILMSILFIFLFYYQIIKHKYYQEKLDTLVGNIVYGETAPRGYIYDRNHKLLVDNIPIKTIYYNKPKNISLSSEIKLAYQVSNLIDLDYSKVTEYDLRDFWVKKNKEKAKKLITKKEEKSGMKGN